MTIKLKLRFLLTFGLCVYISSGCAAKRQITYLPEKATFSPPHIPASIPGVYHTVKRGETLWRISQIYNINLADLVQTNKISNANKIESGQSIFIPDQSRRSKQNVKSFNVKQTFLWPCRGTVVNYFNDLKENVTNHGIDILAREGSLVYAAAAGKIVFSSDNLRGYGKTIIIQHNYDFTTVYTYNQKNLVKTGDYVKQGQIIAQAGKTGRATKCIVHFELRKNNKPQNPFYYLP